MMKSITLIASKSIVVLSWLLAGSGAFAQSSPAAYTTYFSYNIGSRLTATVLPPASGVTGPFLATRNTYNSEGMISKVESGSLSTFPSQDSPPSAWTGFSIVRTVEFTYDIWGQKLTEKVTGSDGSAATLTQTSYDANGRIDCVAIRLNPAAFNGAPSSACSLGAEGIYGPDRIAKNTYDSLSRITRIQRAFGTPLQYDYAKYSYYPGGPRQSAIDANGNYSLYEYDGLVRQSRWYFPSKTLVGQHNPNDFEEYSYDNAGNRLSLRKRDSGLVQYTYDSLNRLRVESYPGGTLASIYSGYDLQGHQLYSRLLSDAGLGITTAYDGFGRVTSSSTNQSGSVRGISYSYNTEGLRTRITHPDGQFFNYGYDGLGRLTSIAEGAGALLAAYSYDAQGRKNALTRGGGVSSTTYSYDALSRLQTLTQDLAGTAYDEVRTFGYNPANQVLSRNLSNGVYTFSQVPMVSTTYQVNGLNQYTQLISGSAVAPTHDANGNMTWDGLTTYNYDALNRLTSSTGSKPATLGYDPKGRLLQTYSVSRGSTQYLYDADALVIEYGSSGSVLRRYVHGASTDEPLILYEGAAVNAGSRRYYHADHQGSVIAAVDSAGSAPSVNTFDPYGVPGSANNTRFQYTGQMFLPELGLYHYKARIYNQGIGRFMQVDPIGYKDDLDLYSYVGEDPVNRNDPTGTSALDLGFLAYDIVKLGVAVYSGIGIGPAAADVAVSIVAAVNPVPLTGALMKTAIGTERVLSSASKVEHGAAAAKGVTGLGKHAGESIPARSAARDFTAAERAEVNAIGVKTGCQTCGTTNPGTKSGNFVPDHQPPSALNAKGEPQRLYPQCINCSREQGLEIARQLRREGQ